MAIRVRLAGRSYPIIVASSYRRLPASLAAGGLPREVWVISHRALLRRQGRELLSCLRRGGFRVHALSVPASESSKSFAQAQRLIRLLSRTATMRVPMLLAFGGGVVGDLAGFVAAVFRRGVPYVQVPTTLLAQVDSAIGGKVGVDLPHAKNFVGAFYQPRLVYSNTAVLRSLPLRQRRSGLAEVMKYGVIADAPLFAFLETHLRRCLALEPSAVQRMVEASSRIKARVVSRDERDTSGVRAQLNFGHTLGHALEAATRYRRWTHGEAIAIGMCAAADLGVEADVCAPSVRDRIVRLIQRAGLPTRATGVSLRAVQGAMRFDKKFIRGCSRWVVPTTIGRVVVTERLSASAVHRVLRRRLA